MICLYVDFLVSHTRKTAPPIKSKQMFDTLFDTLVTFIPEKACKINGFRL